MDRPNLSGQLVLVPAGRVGVNVLARLMERAGADVVTFPPLEGAPPANPEPLRRALGELEGFDWIVFSGALSVEGFFEARDGVAAEAPLPGHLRVGAIGSGAVSALKARAVPVQYAPRAHTAPEVAVGMGDASGLAVLLVRREGSPPDLPDALERAGARVTDVAGFRAIAEPDAPEAADLEALEPDLVAFGNPTAVRIFAESASALEIDVARWLRRTRVVVVGPATAEEARRHGIEPDLVSAGQLQDLMRDLAVDTGSETR